jgi:hypothetical protein
MNSLLLAANESLGEYLSNAIRTQPLDKSDTKVVETASELRSKAHNILH